MSVSHQRGQQKQTGCCLAILMLHTGAAFLVTACNSNNKNRARLLFNALIVKRFASEYVTKKGKMCMMPALFPYYPRPRFSALPVADRWVNVKIRTALVLWYLLFVAQLLQGSRNVKMWKKHPPWREARSPVLFSQQNGEDMSVFLVQASVSCCDFWHGVRHRSRFCNFLDFLATLTKFLMNEQPCSVMNWNKALSRLFAAAIIMLFRSSKFSYGFVWS